MMNGLERLEMLPMSLRPIREMHARLLHSGQGGTKDLGKFRRSGTVVLQHLASVESTPSIITEHQRRGLDFTTWKTTSLLPHPQFSISR